MAGQTQAYRLNLWTTLGRTLFTLTAVFMVIGVAMLPVQAQTLAVLHTFTGGADGANPYAGVVLDRGGNLYGTASLGGSTNCVEDQSIGCGTIFKLSRQRGGWTYNVLYTFLGGGDGNYPEAPLTLGPDGAPYGTTTAGGNSGCAGLGCGTVFKLQPPVTFCRAISCPWNKAELYQFTGGLDGGLPYASLIFDPSGSLYGTTSYAQANQYYGSAYELTRQGQGWNSTILYTFTQFDQEASPFGGMIFDRSGNLWGTTFGGGIADCDDPHLPDYCGTLFELTPTESGWSERVVYEFHRSVGGGPTGSLIMDQAGNLYGTLQEDGPNGNGSVYQYNPSTGLLRVLYSASGNGESPFGPQSGVVMDSVGNLYGVDAYANYAGFVFKLTPSNGNWIFTDLHDFTGGADGAAPYGTLAIDADGSIYGTTIWGGTNNYGVVFQITQ